MTSINSRGLEVLGRDECLSLLAADDFGRVVVLHGHTPAIFPVNYVLTGGAIVFRTDPGTKLDAGPRAPACFEIDAVDRTTRVGWSVVATGRLEEVTRYDSKTWSRVHTLPLEPWAGGEKAHWMRLVPDRVSGRRISAGTFGPTPPSS
jgi:nitroimidazol reductase NimA-like FMN-containing flavoprotein (pyridoxamine 5'-phosphate oxidase superfamily)